MLTNIFYHVDNFCKNLEKLQLQEQAKNQGGRPPRMSLSEILTIYIYYHHSGFKNFKFYYMINVKGTNRSAYGCVVSYNRFVEIIQEKLPFLALFALYLNTAATGFSFIDSTTLAVCNNKRIHSHKVMKGLAQRGKSSMGWFYGFKLHFVINEHGQIISFTITPGNVDDRDPEVIAKVTKDLFGKLFGDRGYISQSLFEELWSRGIQLITKLKHNMKNKLMPMEDKLLLRRRGIIEPVGNLLKNFLDLEHTRHRSVKGFFCNLLSCISAYAFHNTKPSLLRANKYLESNTIA